MTVPLLLFAVICSTVVSHAVQGCSNVDFSLQYGRFQKAIASRDSVAILPYCAGWNVLWYHGIQSQGMHYDGDVAQAVVNDTSSAVYRILLRDAYIFEESMGNSTVNVPDIPYGDTLTLKILPFRREGLQLYVRLYFIRRNTAYLLFNTFATDINPYAGFASGGMIANEQSGAREVFDGLRQDGRVTNLEDDWKTFVKLVKGKNGSGLKQRLMMSDTAVREVMDTPLRAAILALKSIPYYSQRKAAGEMRDTPGFPQS